MSDAPISATIFAYQVGFGDCFLLRFNYPATQRHVLIDFGTTGLPEAVASDPMLTIAKDIAEKCGGTLDAVVATHRHADHISGFATKSGGGGSGDVIRALKPKVVIQPWTEEPALAVNARGPVAQAESPAAKKIAAVRALAYMHTISEQVVEMLDRPTNALSKRVAAELRFVGEDNLSNLSAVKNLATMGKKAVYTYSGSTAGLASILPGVTTHVLGPPTLKQTDTISKQRARDPDEFWQLQMRRLADEASIAVNATPLFPGAVIAKGGKLPLNARWIAYRLKEASSDQALGLVRALDKQMNNTSLILLFETKTKKLLFPGDAQIENWQYALSIPKFTELLADIDVYKVGHHGSLNATPKSMWKLFKKKGGAKTKDRLRSVMSTKPGKHGSIAARTEVPRSTLLAELKAHSELHSTDALAPGVLYEEIQIDF